MPLVIFVSINQISSIYRGFFCLLFIHFTRRPYLILCNRVQLLFPVIQEMQESKVSKLAAGCPPHTTSLPSVKRERLCPFLGSGSSGMEQLSDGGGGNTSTFERSLRPSSVLPPITTCPTETYMSIQPPQLFLALN